MPPLRSWVAGLVALACVMIGSGRALADDFGSIKKPAVPASFFSHDAGWITFFYPPSARERVGPLIAQADEVRAELGRALGAPLLEGVEVRIARGPDEMAGFAPQIRAGSPSPMAVKSTTITFPALKLIVLSLGEFGAAEPVALGEALRRELGRVALHAAMHGRPLPAWFSDGFAMEFAGERTGSRQWLLFKAYLRRAIAPLDALDDLMTRGGADAELAIAEGADFVGTLLRPETRGRFAACAARVKNGEPFATALAAAYGKSFEQVEKTWRDDLGGRCGVRAVALAFAVPGALIVALFAFRTIRRRKVRRKAPRKLPESRAVAPEKKRVHVVFARRDEHVSAPTVVEPEVPRVEHEGEWHTLH
jgi:hypothetical protein